MDDLLTQLGNIDIYLFDQLLKGRIEPGKRILDAGCGGGRNIAYLLGKGCDVHCVDRCESAVQACSRLIAGLRPDLPAGNIRHEALERLSFEDSFFDLVIASAVLHFADDEDHFAAMLRELWRVLQPGGLLFARLASSRCLADRIQWVGPRKGQLPDGSLRFVIDDEYLIQWEERLGALRLDPIKTTLVEGLRAMTTWVLRKPL